MMRAMSEKIFLKLLRLMEGGVQRRILPPSGHFSHEKHLHIRKKMVVKIQNGTIWGGTTPQSNEAAADLNLVCTDRSSFKFWKRVSSDQYYWNSWTESNRDHSLWKKKNSEEQRRDLEARWTYLKDILHAARFDTRDHRQLLSIKFGDRDGEGSTIIFTVASPENGLTSLKYLKLPPGGAYILPRQTVNGLVLITTIEEEFLIYNPSTGERSEWIEASTVCKENQRKKKSRRVVDCIALGYSPKSNQHKVICISSRKNKKSAASEYNPRHGRADQQVGAEDQIVEIFTVGENTWRRIDAVPPFCVGSRSELVDSPYYVNGSMYWRFQYTKTGEVVMGFDFDTEKFRVIPIPEFIIDPKKPKVPTPVQLTEVDGCVAVVALDYSAPPQTFLGVIREDSDGNVEWTEEMFVIPHWRIWWYREPVASVEVLKGTNLILVLPGNSNCFYYYNRDTKEYVKFPILPDRDENSFERIMQL